jgi:ArpU family phage transcriptional regulator
MEKSSAGEIIKIPEHIFVYVEKELYSYKIYKLAVTELGLDLQDVISQYGQMSTDRIPSHSGPGDPVNLSVLKSLIIEEKIKQYLSRIRKIEAGINLLSNNEKGIVEKKYFSEGRFSNDQIMMELHLNRNSFYKMRDDIVYKFSLIFGVL